MIVNESAFLLLSATMLLMSVAFMPFTLARRMWWSAAGLTLAFAGIVAQLTARPWGVFLLCASFACMLVSLYVSLKASRAERRRQTERMTDVNAAMGSDLPLDKFDLLVDELYNAGLAQPGVDEYHPVSNDPALDALLDRGSRAGDACWSAKGIAESLASDQDRTAFDAALVELRKRAEELRPVVAALVQYVPKKS